MKVYDYISDKSLFELFDAILSSGGLIHGGCLRDLFHKQPYKFKDIDVYYSDLNGFQWSGDNLDYRFINHLSSLIKDKPLLKNVFLNQVDGDTDNHGYFLNNFKNCKFKIYVLHKPIILDVIYRHQQAFTAKNNFLDFDINSLYLTRDGTINSSLGSNKVDDIIEKIKEGQCKLIRSDVPDERIKHILNKGFTCNLVPFL